MRLLNRLMHVNYKALGDLSFDDRYEVDVAAPLLVPQTSIVDLEGGSNLAVLLWTFVLYNGIIGILSNRPAELILPYLSKILLFENEQWFKDYKDGYAFNVPPSIEAARVGIFLVTGYYLNLLITNSFEGDVFWGYAFAGAIAIPSGLFSLARPKLITREKANFIIKMEEDFSDFAADNLVLNAVGSNNSIMESTIIIAFRRKFKGYREEAQVSDKDIRKIVRKYIGVKPKSIDCVYTGVELLNTPKSFKKLNEEALLKSKQMEEAYRQQVQNEVEDATSTTSGSDFSR